MSQKVFCLLFTCCDGSVILVVQWSSFGNVVYEHRTLDDHSTLDYNTATILTG